MKYIGILIMAASLIAAGFTAANGLKDRMELLFLFHRMILNMKGQILYSNDTLPQAMKKIGEDYAKDRTGISKEIPDFFLRIVSRLEKEPGNSLPGIWKAETERISEKLPLAEADKNSLLALGENLGCADRETQERTFLFYLKQTEDAMEGLKRDMERKGRLYRCLGMSAGLLLMIVLA